MRRGQPLRESRPHHLQGGGRTCEITAVPIDCGIDSGTTEGVTMTGDDPVRTCLEELRGSEEIGAARRIAQERGPALLGRKGVASGLVAIALDGDDGDREHALALFRGLIGEAGADREDRGGLGGRFLEEAETAIGTLVVRDALDPDGALELTNAYAQGEVEAPEALVSWLMARLEALARSEAGDGLGGLDEEIDRVREAADEDDHDLYRIVDRWLAPFPAQRKVGVVRHIAGRAEDFGGRLALYWLLDASAEVRLAAAGGVNGRVNMRIVEPDSLSLVPLVRNWMPADAARGLVDAALREARLRGLFSPLGDSAGRPVRFLGSLPDGSGVQEFAAVAEGDDDPLLALAVTRPGRGVERGAVLRGEHAWDGMAELENSPDTFELSREALELLLGAGVADGLDKGRMAPAGLIDVALACGLTELRPRPMTVGDWTGELDGDREISGLGEAEREVLVRESAAWPDRHPAVEAWSEGTALYREALDAARASNGTEEEYWSRMEGRREDWAQTMLRAAYVLKDAGNGDWRSFAATALALVDGRSLKTIPIMDRIYVETLAAFAREALGRLSEEDDGTAELGRLTAAAAWPDGDDAVAPSMWLDGYLAAGVLAPSGTGPEMLYAEAAERFGKAGVGPGAKPLRTHITDRYAALQTVYGETRTVASMFLAADDLGVTEWARGFAQGVKVVESAWPTEWFVAEERRMMSLLARLAEGEMANLDDCTDVVTFIQWRWQARYEEGTQSGGGVS